MSVDPLVDAVGSPFARLTGSCTVPESVFTPVKLVARFWRFVDSVLNTEKHVRSM